MRFLAAMLVAIIFAAGLAGCGGDKPAQSHGASAIPSAVVASMQPSPTGTALSTSTSPGASAAPSPTEDLQGESKQALDDLNQALKELDDMNSDNTDSQNAINGLN